MNRFTRWLERRSTIATPPADLLALFSSGVTDSGALVSPQTALQVPSVYACLSVLAQDIGRTPVKFREQTAPDTFQDVPDHPLSEILGSLPNPEMTSYELQFAMMWELLLYGVAYAEVVRQDGRIIALWPLRSEAMRVDRVPGVLTKRWTYADDYGKTWVWLFDASAPPVLEIRMPSPIQRCREVIGTALALNTYVAKFFGNGAQPRGLLQAKGPLTDTQAQRLLTIWNTGHRGAALAHSVGIIDSGIEFKPVSLQNDQAQMVELLRAVNEQIAGIFRVPVSKIGDLSKSNYSNLQVSEQVYVTSTLDPYYRAFELAFRRDLLTVRQYQQFTVEFDRAALTRNDVKALHDALCQGLQAGIYSQNDCRKALGLNPIPDGDRYFINSALQPIGTPKELPVVA